MDELTCGPPGLCSEQTVKQIHIKEEETGDTGWEQNEEQHVCQEMYSEDQESYAVSHVAVPTRHPGNETYNSTSGEQTTDTDWLDVLSEETYGVNCTQPEEGVSSHLHVQACTRHVGVNNTTEQTTDTDRQQDKKRAIPNNETSGVNYTGSAKEVLIQGHTIQEGSHVAGHTYICFKCGYRAAERKLIYEHMRKHADEKNYKCDHCDYSSAEKYVDQHVMVKHAGEKPYICDDDGCKMNDGQHLTQHKTACKGEKRPFDCDHGLNSETCSEPSSQGSVNNTSSEQEKRHADNPLILRSAVPRRHDSDKLFETLKMVFRQEKEANGVICSAVELWADTMQTNCLIEVELRKDNGHGYHICPWPSCRYGRRGRHQVADHVRKLHIGPNFCSQCGHITKSLPAMQRHRKRRGHDTPAPPPLFDTYQNAAVRRYCREMCSEFSVPFSEVH
ncbi:zinc finger protein 93-like [Branchiostoma lanceolatum]|uniref:zinc finger protein 93-like n=1 Tax=Branchiostoma lanceolatum TaxID=7740 RepID=UPI003451E4AF